MLSIEDIRRLLDDPLISDVEVKEIRDAFRVLAEVIFEEWQEERKAGEKLNRLCSSVNKSLT